MRTAIISGPTGAVGVALINELINHNYFVYAICHKNSKRSSNIPVNKNVRVIFSDLSEFSTLSTLPNCDVFFHLAWDGTYGDSRNDINKQFNNIKYSIDSVNFAKRCGCSTYIGIGSQSEYGISNETKDPYDPCFPNNFYGSAKLSTSYLTRTLCNENNIRHIWCRIFSLFGPYDADYTMIMSSMIKMIDGKKCLFTKGDQLWDYIYSKDAAKAFRLIDEKGKNNSIYNIASGKPRLLKEYISAMHCIVNPTSIIELGAIPYFIHQPMNLSANISNLKEDTGFECDYSFEEGIIDLMKFFKKQDTIINAIPNQICS